MTANQHETAPETVPSSFVGEDRSPALRGWLLHLRLASYVILAGVVVVYMGYPKYIHFQFVLYSLCTLAFAVLVSLERRVRMPAVLQTVIGLQFLLEIALEAGIIYATGNIHSSFSALFLLTIVSAALTYRLVGTLLMASTVSLAYSFIIWYGLGGGARQSLGIGSLKTIMETDESLFYSIFLHILIFYLVAFISGYLAERLRVQDTKLVRASLALRRARLETDDILRHLNSGLLTVDAAGHIIYFNRAAERILGYREIGAKGLPCRDVFAERMPQFAERLMNCLAEANHEVRGELDIIDGSGRKIPLGLSTSVLTDEVGSPRGVIAIFSDLTDAKALEAKVRAADRLAAVGELSASIAHEIRNPLTAISGSVEVLRSELSLDGENARLMELIIKESLRLNNILTEFLTYARIGRPQYTKVELCHLVSDITEVLRHHEALCGRTEVRVEADDSCMYVVGDEDLAKQVVMNLALNAAQAFEDGPGRVLIRIEDRPSEGMVDLHVIDNGPGIAPENQARVFEPFYSTKKHGTGLGLAIVHRICSILKYSINMTSVPGAGTTFTVTFPRYAPDRAAESPSGESAPTAALR